MYHIIYKEIGDFMSKLKTIKGVLKTFMWMSKEDFQAMDHKLIRIGVGAAGFVVMALIWLFFLSSIIPF